VRHLGEELATFRKRALMAETQLKDAKLPTDMRSEASSERVTELERENEALRKRLEQLDDRVRQMMDRVRFLRQQLQSQAPAGAGGRS
jgi:TolA-binding protein